jgi:hypothetical protein
MLHSAVSSVTIHYHNPLQAQSLGVLISYNIYINSPDFTSDILFKAISGGLCLLTLYLLLKVNEKNYQSQMPIRQALATSYQLIK